MKYQRHKRKESFSVLMISNTDRSSRQFQISLFSLRLIAFLLLLLFVALGLLIYQFFTGHKERDAMRIELDSQKKLTQQLETENKTLQQTIIQTEEKEKIQKTEAPEAKATPEPMKDSTFPSLYPSQGSSVLRTSYSQENPYLSISTYMGSSIVAAAEGTITSISSDETHRHIIEISHKSGYTTRYLCHQEGELKVTEGAQVQPGDILITITTDDTQLDYQIVYEGAPVDPLTLIDAKG